MEAGQRPGHAQHRVRRRPPTIRIIWKRRKILVEWFPRGGVNLTIEQLTWADWHIEPGAVNKDFQMSMMNFFGLWESEFLWPQPLSLGADRRIC